MHRTPPRRRDSRSLRASTPNRQSPRVRLPHGRACRKTEVIVPSGNCH
jgi:hypothetical protein